VSKKNRVRFRFEITDGPNSGLSCPGWRVWTTRDSIYMAGAETGSMWKLSLHGDVAWRYAQTSENRRSPNPVLPQDHDRAPWTFEPTPFIDGVRHAFAVAVFRHALVAAPPDPSELVLPVDDRWDTVTTLFLQVTEVGTDLETTRSVVREPLPMSAGRRLWLTLDSEFCGGEPEPPAVGTMIEPAAPATHGVAFPGVFVRGVHLG